MLWIEYRARVGRRTDFADDFNRADAENINDGAPMTPAHNWSDNAEVDIVSNQLVYSGGFDARVMLTPVTGYSDMWCEVDVYADPDTSNTGLLVRNVVATATFYGFRYLGSVGSSQWELYKCIAGTYTLLDSLSETKPSSPFRILLEVDGTSVRGYQVVAGTPVLKCTGTLDGSVNGTGLGIWVQRYSTNAIADNFEGGPL